jgi:hypothetical protein
MRPPPPDTTAGSYPRGTPGEADPEHESGDGKLRVPEGGQPERGTQGMPFARARRPVERFRKVG